MDRLKDIPIFLESKTDWFCQFYLFLYLSKHNTTQTTMRLFALLFLIYSTTTLYAQPFTKTEIARWQKQAQNVTIIRDNWGIPHIYGKTDADAVFGMLYAQCEDDFLRVEDNYIVALGRKAEVDGENLLCQDLRARLFLDTTQAIAIYEKSPAWMKELLHAFADGVNFYLHTHPEVKPRLLTRFQPYFPLMFSEGSIGGDIGAVSLARLEAFYGKNKSSSYLEHDINDYLKEPTGSNGFAIAPSRSASGNALLLINPHTSFYFRPEIHVTSEKGLNAYGAVTWGQFFVYQGFNENCGWMHTSSSADVIDEYLETVEKRDSSYFYKHGKEWRPVQTKKIKLAYKLGDSLQNKEFTTYFTHHGPVIAKQDDKWLSISMMNEPLKALTLSFTRTKSSDYKSYNEAMQIRANSSNNTVFADRKGNIAYWHGDFMPKRDPKFDWENPVDGSNPETDWKGLHDVKEIVQLLNPANGWIQNCNSTPFTAAAENSPKKNNYPNYMAPDAENYRGIHAVQVLSRESKFDLDLLIAAAYDAYLPGFEEIVPALIKAYREVAGPASTYSEGTAEAIYLLGNWDKRFSASSIPTTLAVLWGEKLQSFARSKATNNQGLTNITINQFAIENTTPEEKVTLLSQVIEELTRDFGTWKLPWGDINRFQRLNGNVVQTFDDDAPSIPVGFASANWGSLASFGIRGSQNTKKRYGSYGNSFVAVVEFGKRLKAKSILAGGQSSDPNSKHFTDQASMYAAGKFKDVLFYLEDVKKNAERTYKPGDK